MDTPSPLAVVCDRCRAAGIAGDPNFADIPDLLAFEPVPVRAHVNNWTAEHQRAFIAALAVTGSARQAARSIGRYPAGAERLRKARGGRSFAEAWDAALEVARDREVTLVHDNARAFASEHRVRNAAALATCEPGPHVRALYGDDYDPDEYLENHAELVEAHGRIRDRMLGARRLYLAVIAQDPDRRAAWEVLVGPTDWDKAAAHEPQDDETAYDNGTGLPAIPNMLQADMVLTADAGLLPELTGGPDALGIVLAELAEEQRQAIAVDKGDETDNG